MLKRSSALEEHVYGCDCAAIGKKAKEHDDDNINGNCAEDEMLPFFGHVCISI